MTFFVTIKTFEKILGIHFYRRKKLHEQFIANASIHQKQKRTYI